MGGTHHESVGGEPRWKTYEKIMPDYCTYNIPIMIPIEILLFIVVMDSSYRPSSIESAKAVFFLLL